MEWLPTPHAAVKQLRLTIHAQEPIRWIIAYPATVSRLIEYKEFIDIAQSIRTIPTHIIANVFDGLDTKAMTVEIGGLHVIGSLLNSQKTTFIPCWLILANISPLVKG